MERVETRELSYFVTLAEELHFGRAAERLGIAQPPLSRAIGRLERRMGVQLFERTSRRVGLTAAGEVFLAESRKALAAVDAAVARAQHTGRPHRLIVATRPGTGAGLLADVLRAYSRQPGSAEVEVLFTHDQVGTLRSGSADVALVCGSQDTEGLETVLIAEEPWVALLPAGHKLATHPAVTVAELSREEGFREVCPEETVAEIIERVDMGRLIVMVGASLADRLGRAVVAVPVMDVPSNKLVLAWPEGVPLAARKAFVRTARNVAVGHVGLDQASWTCVRPPSTTSSIPVT